MYALLIAAALAQQQPRLPGNAELTPNLKRQMQEVDARREYNNFNRARQQVESKVQRFRQQATANSLISPASEFAIIKQDLLTVKPELRASVRYMTAGFYPEAIEVGDFVEWTTDENGINTGQLAADPKNPYIPKIIQRQVTTHEMLNRVAIFGLNSLSLEGDIYLVEGVPGTRGRIIRFYLHNYRLHTPAWEKLVANDVYFRHIYDPEVAQLCGSYRPIIRSDWFLAKCFTEPNYSRLLFSSVKYPPRNEAEWIKFFKVNIQDVRDLNRDTGAAVSGATSYVARNDRRLKRWEDILVFHYTDDFRSNADFVRKDTNGKPVMVLKDPLEHLLNPVDHRVTYEPDAHEGIVELPNELQGYMISDGQGNLVQKADIGLGIRDSKNSYDPQVFNGKSCIWCHERGMNIPVNAAEKHLGRTVDIKSYDPETLRFLKRFYQGRYGSAIRNDSMRYCIAVAKCNGLDATNNAVAFRTYVQWYDYSHITAEQAARELGCTTEQLRRAATRSASFRLMGLFGSPPTTIQRDLWENYYQAAILLLNQN